MGRLIETDRTPTFGPWVRHLRLYLQLTQKEIARLAKVRIKDIALLENNKPVSLKIKTRILKELYKLRTRNWEIFTNC
jgi:transcriptional regulator with XRE-family HTH domain